MHLEQMPFRKKEIREDDAFAKSQFTRALWKELDNSIQLCCYQFWPGCILEKNINNQTIRFRQHRNQVQIFFDK